MSKEDRKKLTEMMLATGRKNHVNEFLLNQKETAFGFSPLEIRRLPFVLRNNGFSTEDKMAIVINPDSLRKPLFGFLREILALSSLRVQVFNDNLKAIAWLKESN